VALVPSQPPNLATRILVAEDHAVNQKFMALMLKRLGYDVTFCDNGQSAVEAIENASFDLVFMDIHMPVMDGLSATRVIRGMAGPKSRVPIIALTADVFTVARSQAEAAGVNAFITKPVKQAELEAAILRILHGAWDGGRA
jgi:CheY-like chemotaxis protein